MFLNKAKRADSGVVLATVLMVTVVMSMMLAAFLSQNMSQSSSAKTSTDQIVAQTLAQGAFWKVYEDMNAGIAPAGFSEPSLGVGGSKTYTVTVDSRPPNSQTKYNVVVSYN